MQTKQARLMHLQQRAWWFAWWNNWLQPAVLTAVHDQLGKRHADHSMPAVTKICTCNLHLNILSTVWLRASGGSEETPVHRLLTVGAGRPFNDGIDFSQVLHDTLCRNGPCPGLAIGNRDSWRRTCIDAKNMVVNYVYVYMDPSGQGAFKRHCPEVTKAMWNWHDTYDAEERVDAQMDICTAA